MLGSLPKRELDLHLLLDSGSEEYGTESMVLTDAVNLLGEWQKEDAVEHWKRESCSHPVPTYTN